ncbi:CMRF35-like molecule 6 [Tupaia chinensis]|uniref:CMRF35-like molecule 6 n=1 Tax=Tupaia chinensis TaxID=246437 RepID=UPI000FFCAC6B|nr:CMRF35-like molecule 6 [Tupaia chinensis]
MTRGGTAWLPSALLLLHIPGCFPLSGPSAVRGTVGGSLRLKFQYEQKFQANSKYWCRKPHHLLCDKIVETQASELEVRSGRVSIRDHPTSLTFIVTLENLTEEDAGTYWSAIKRPWDLDRTQQVVVFVSPDRFDVPGCVKGRPSSSPGGFTTGCSPGSPTGEALSRFLSCSFHPDSDLVCESGLHRGQGWETRWGQSPDCVFPSAPTTSSSPERPTPGPPTILPVGTWSTATRQDTSDLSPQPWSLVSSIHFLLLVFLKLPLLLGMLSAVLWVNRPQRTWGRQSRWKQAFKAKACKVARPSWLAYVL